MHLKKPTRQHHSLIIAQTSVSFVHVSVLHSAHSLLCMAYMHRPRLCIAYTDRLRKMLKPKNKYRASARAQHAFPAVHIHTHTHTHPSSPPQADSLPALYVFRNSRSSYCRTSAALCVGAGRQTQWLCGAGERARGRDNDKLEVYIS